MQTAPSFATPSATPGVRATAPAPRRLVTDAPTRMFHWLFAASFAGAWLTAESEHWRLVHVTLGYIFAGLLGFRLLYAVFGPRQASLMPLWRKVTAIPAWLRTLRAPSTWSMSFWRQGQHLAMGLAIALMLALVIPLTLSGYASYNDWGGNWGGDVLEETHELFANLFLAIIFGHLGLIALFSLLRRQNVALPMLTGRMPGAGASPVKHNHAWLAALLLVAVLGFGAWQWFDAPTGDGPSAGTPSVQVERTSRHARHGGDD